MNTIRHNYKLKWGKSIAIAPRLFSIARPNYKNEYKTYFVHICDFNCTCVEIYLLWGNVVNNEANVILHNVLKLYTNSKGLYFNFSYWINNFEKKTIRVYICE